MTSYKINRVLIACGALSSLWYVAINIYVPMQYEGYDIASFTVSELSAIGAPTRKLWIALVVVYPLLFAAFGWGLLKSTQNNRALKTIGKLIIAYCIFNIYWPPMHQRGNQPTLTDALHIAWASVTVLFMIVMMVIGAFALKKSFRIFTIASLILLTVFGILTSTEAPNIPTNRPTPWIGVWERINIGIFMLWIMVLSITILRRQNESNI